MQSEAQTITSLSLKQIKQLISQDILTDSLEIDQQQIQLITTIAYIVQVQETDSKVVLIISDTYLKINLVYSLKQEQKFEIDKYYRFYLAIKSHKSSRYALCIGLSPINDYNELSQFFAQVIVQHVSRKQAAPQQPCIKQVISYDVEKKILELLLKNKGNRGVSGHIIYQVCGQQFKHSDIDAAIIRLKQIKAILQPNPYFFAAADDASEKMSELVHNQ